MGHQLEQQPENPSVPSMDGVKVSTSKFLGLIVQVVTLMVCMLADECWTSRWLGQWLNSDMPWNRIVFGIEFCMFVLTVIGFTYYKTVVILVPRKLCKHGVKHFVREWS